MRYAFRTITFLVLAIWVAAQSPIAAQEMPWRSRAQTSPNPSNAPAPKTMNMAPPQKAAPPTSPAQQKGKTEAERRPDPPENVLFRPNFLTPDLSHYAGLAFRLRHEASGQHFLVTGHSLFSPAYGLDVQMTASDIARVIVAAIGVSCTDRNKIVVAQPYVPIPDARPYDDKGSERDLALFRISAKAGEPSLLLDPAPPILGDRVWIYVKYSGSPRIGLEPASIAWISPREIRYLLDNKSADLRNTTGAPLLDIDGRVVGMHLGTFVSSSGRTFGFGCPAAAIAPCIEPPKKIKSLL